MTPVVPAPTRVEIDHVFVCCEAGAPEADALKRIGLREGSGNVHPGQGTANRRFFFANAYLELLWVADEDQARGESTRRTRLWERWSARASGASPFGVLLRPGRVGERAPFATWSYRPAYLPAGAAIEFAESVPLHEPALAFLPFVRQAGPRSGEPLDHAVPLRRLVAVRIGVPDATALSAAARAVRATAAVAYFAGGAVLDLVFEGAPTLVHDLRPALPLRLCGS